VTTFGQACGHGRPNVAEAKNNNLHGLEPEVIEPKAARPTKPPLARFARGHNPMSAGGGATRCRVRPTTNGAATAQDITWLSTPALAPEPAARSRGATGWDFLQPPVAAEFWLISGANPVRCPYKDAFGHKAPGCAPQNRQVQLVQGGSVCLRRADTRPRRRPAGGWVRYESGPDGGTPDGTCSGSECPQWAWQDAE
jgi:hypothetical protein